MLLSSIFIFLFTLPTVIGVQVLQRVQTATTIPARSYLAAVGGATTLVAPQSSRSITKGDTFLVHVHFFLKG